MVVETLLSSLQRNIFVGKFMAFPGEHYHNLLSCLASEIYHNRYPVEYGIDVLHAMMREAGPGVAKVTQSPRSLA